jgi:hypothetical protein
MWRIDNTAKLNIVRLLKDNENYDWKWRDGKRKRIKNLKVKGRSCRDEIEIWGARHWTWNIKNKLYKDKWIERE